VTSAGVGERSETRVKASLIVAMTRAGLIGRDNRLPWHYREDLQHFKRSTLDQTIVMGRRSFESLGKALPRRTNLVVSRTLGGGTDGAGLDGARAFSSLAGAFAWIERERPHDSDHGWIIGGGELFRAVLAPLDEGPGAHAAAGLHVPERLVVTWVPDLPGQPDDVHFPFDAAWLEGHYDVVERRPGETEGLEFVTYALRR